MASKQNGPRMRTGRIEFAIAIAILWRIMHFARCSLQLNASHNIKTQSVQIKLQKNQQ